MLGKEKESLFSSNTHFGETRTEPAGRPGSEHRLVGRTDGGQDNLIDGVGGVWLRMSLPPDMFF